MATFFRAKLDDFKEQKLIFSNRLLDNEKDTILWNTEQKYDNIHKNEVQQIRWSDKYW